VVAGCRVQVDGPLESFAAGIEEVLAADGYTDKWLSQLMWLVADLSCWLGERGLAAGELTGPVIEEFFASVGSSRSRCRSSRSLKPIVAYLRSVGALAVEEVAGLGRSDVEEELLGSFRRWCVAQRGLTAQTAEDYAERVAVFLRLWRPDAEFVVAELDGRGVLSTVRAAADVLPRPLLRCLVTALRSFLRFLHATGRSSTQLVGAVPAMKSWPRTALPSAIPAAEARRLVAACDTTTARGRRDAAVLIVLVRLGLRAH
jgi:integrase/recombinase XerD